MEGIGLRVNTFEHVSSDNHQMSVAGRRGRFPGLMSGGGQGRGRGQGEEGREGGGEGRSRGRSPGQMSR